MPRVWISIGSNQDRESSVRFAVDELRRRFGKLLVSSVYQTPAQGFDGADFWNLVAGLETDLPVADLHRNMHEIEALAGRKRGGERYSDRTLDLDVLTYGEQVGDDGGKALPRSDITEYDFVLAPLVDVAPKELHPKLGVSYEDLWRDRRQPRPKVVDMAL